MYRLIIFERGRSFFFFFDESELAKDGRDIYEYRLCETQENSKGEKGRPKAKPSGDSKGEKREERDHNNGVTIASWLWVGCTSAATVVDIGSGAGRVSEASDLVVFFSEDHMLIVRSA